MRSAPTFAFAVALVAACDSTPSDIPGCVLSSASCVATEAGADADAAGSTVRGDAPDGESTD